MSRHFAPQVPKPPANKSFFASFFAKKEALTYFAALTATCIAPVAGSITYTASPPAPLTQTANSPPAPASPMIRDPAGSALTTPAGAAVIDGVAGLA
jgi:hypothetical protein